MLKAAEQLEWPPLLWSRAPRWLVKVQGEPQRWGTFGGSLRHPEPAALQPVQGGAHAVAGPGRGSCVRGSVDKVFQTCRLNAKKACGDLQARSPSRICPYRGGVGI